MDDTIEVNSLVQIDLSGFKDQLADLNRSEGVDVGLQ